MTMFHRLTLFGFGAVLLAIGSVVLIPLVASLSPDDANPPVVEALTGAAVSGILAGFILLIAAIVVGIKGGISFRRGWMQYSLAALGLLVPAGIMGYFVYSIIDMFVNPGPWI